MSKVVGNKEKQEDQKKAMSAAISVRRRKLGETTSQPVPQPPKK